MKSPRRMLAAIACAGAFALMASPPCPAQAPGAKPKPLARYVPANDLVFFAEFDGLAAHDAAWKKTALSRVLSETKLGAMIDDLARQGVTQWLAAEKDGEKPTPDELIGMYKAVIRDGAAFGVAGVPGAAPPLTVTILRNGAKNAVHDYITRIKARTAKGGESKRGERTIYGEGNNAPSWWFEGDDLVLVSRPDQVDAVLAVLDGKAPNATTHPIRAELVKAAAGSEPVAVGFLDFAKIPMPPPAAQLGLDGLKRIDYRVAFEGEAIASAFRVLAPAPRRGILAMLDGMTFDRDALPPIPAGLTSWTVFALQPAMVYDRFRAILATANPQGVQGIDAFEQGIQQNLGLRFKEDFLAQLGPRWVFYVDGEAPPAGQPIGKVRASLMADVRDQAAFAKTIDKVMAIVNQVMQAQAQQNGGRPLPSFAKVEGPTPGYRMVFPAGTLPPQVAGIVEPTMLVGKKQFVISASGAEAKAAVAVAAPWKATPEFAAAMAKVPRNVFSLSVDDPRATIPPLVAQAPTLVASLNMMLAAQAAQRPGDGPNVQLKLDPASVPKADEISRRLFPNATWMTVDRDGLTVASRESIPSTTSAAGAGVLVGLLLPAVQSAREAARRSQCTNNEKQIGLALHNYHDMHNAFPPAASMSKAGKPLLSWRVELLPLLEQQDLYNQFHRDEPWDSPHNKTLIAKMPEVFKCPSRPHVEPGTTTYKAFVGGGALFDKDKGVGFQQVTDGTSNTMAVVEGKTPVIWTKPDDIPFDPKAPAGLLDCGSDHPGGFNTLFADGSVRFIKNSIAAQLFRALITRAGGEVIQAEAF